MKIKQSGYFSRSVKKLHAQEKSVLDDAVRQLIENPVLGELRGDLASVRVYKFKFNIDKMLLAYFYQPDIETITLLAYGSHENFYRDLKKNI